MLHEDWSTMARALPVALFLIATISHDLVAQPISDDIGHHAAAKRSGAATYGRLDGPLQKLVRDLALESRADVRGAGARRVPVTVRFRLSAIRRASILAAYGVAPANEDRDVVEAYVPVDALERLSLDPDVVAIDAIIPPTPLIVGQGASVHKALSWQAAGHAGGGVKVGVIDVGFIGLTSLIGSELPTTVIGRCYSTIGSFTNSLAACETGTWHGTGVAEAVSDVAPAIQLYVANPMSPLDLRSTVAWMTSHGVRVINHSVAWSWSGPGDGTTPFSDAPLTSVDAAVTGGAVWANSAGNSALSTWNGPYVDANRDSLLEFTGAAWANGVALSAGEPFVAQARWQDSWTAASRDLDLYLLDSTGHVVAASQANQDGATGLVPLELVVFTPSQSGSYYLAVSHYSGAIPQWVDVQAFSGEPLQYRTVGHSIANPAETANPGGLAVGAVPWYNTGTIEPFSSIGPTRDGRIKPDVVGADRADSVTYGAGGFAGTSQASPHIAGLAALVFETFPSTSPRLVADYLRAVAAPRGSPNNTFGVGFAQVPVFPATVSVSALLTSTQFPATVGQAISWTAFAIGAQAPFEYRFWLFREGVGWSVLQDYGSSNVVTWTPSSGGTYALQVWARRVGSSASYEDWRGSGSFFIQRPPPITVARLVANVVFPAVVNTAITWTAVASGGVAPLQYQFWRFRDGVGWSIVRDYSPINTLSWTPGASEIGRYALQVWVRSAGSTAAYDAWAGTGFFDIISPPVIVTSLSANVTFPALTGAPITWTAIATGGIAALQYKFWRFKQGVGWSVVQDYASLNTFTWVPGEAEAGTYAIQVWVRQLGSTATYEAWRGTDFFTINSPPPARIVSFTQTPALATTTGTAITWTAAATAGRAPPEYKFWLSSSGTWSVLQDYSPISSVTWTALSAGTYSAQVWVRSNGSSAAYEDWRGLGPFTISASSSVFVSTLSADVSFPAMVTHPITWTAIAGGGNAPLLYKFSRYKAGLGWSVVQDYSPSATYTWTPASSDAGTYAIQAWVRSADSTAAYDDWRGTGFFQVVPPTVLFINSAVGDYIGGGATRVITSADGSFSAMRNFYNGVSITETGPSSWSVDFAAPGDSTLVPGFYAYATRFSFQDVGDAGLSVAGDGRGCNESIGRFVVLEAVYGSDGTQ